MSEKINVDDCVFCGIINKTIQANIRYEDDEVIVFDNQLTWVLIMLLAVTKQHMTQHEMWSGDSITLIGAIASQIGSELCPNGFRLLSNFGDDSMQSQEHAHLHIVGGIQLSRYT